jgi:hypothetical protein
MILHSEETLVVLTLFIHSKICRGCGILYVSYTFKTDLPDPRVGPHPPFASCRIFRRQIDFDELSETDERSAEVAPHLVVCVPISPLRCRN